MVGALLSGENGRRREASSVEWRDGDGRNVADVFPCTLFPGFWRVSGPLCQKMRLAADDIFFDVALRANYLQVCKLARVLRGAFILPVG